MHRARRVSVRRESLAKRFAAGMKVWLLGYARVVSQSSDTRFGTGWIHVFVV